MPGPEYLEIILPALAAGLMIAVLHGPLGIEVLRRGIIFIDLAIAQIAGLSVVLVNLWNHEPSWILLQSAAVASALTAAAFFRWVEKELPREQEAIIGSCFILAASAALLALADHPQGGEEIQHILSGQILFVSWTAVLSFLPVYIAASVLWFCVPAVRQGVWFFVLFALVVTASVQLVGVYVVFASLILPALAVNKFATTRFGQAILCGVIAVTSGLALSILADWPAGPIMVFTYAGAMLAYRLSWRQWA